jgi:hypothetical protein
MDLTAVDPAAELEGDLKWREAELAALKIAVSSTKEGSVRHDALLRAMMALLYAHFEGFCKFAWDIYLNTIQKNNVLRKELNTPLACLSLEEKFKELRHDTSSLSFWEFFMNSCPSLIATRAEFRVPLKTKSNLWPDVYCDNMEQAGLPIGLMEQHKARISSLVSRRNDIAHGQKGGVKNLNEYQRYENDVRDVIHDLAITIIESIEKETFLKKTDNMAFNNIPPTPIP